MKTKLGISCLVLALGAAVALVAWRAGDGGDRRRTAPGASEIEDEIATLRQEVERLKNQPRVVLAAGAVTAPAAGAPAVQDVPPAQTGGTWQGEEEDARASESAEAAARALDQHLEGTGGISRGASRSPASSPARWRPRCPDRACWTSGAGRPSVGSRLRTRRCASNATWRRTCSIYRLWRRGLLPLRPHQRIPAHGHLPGAPGPPPAAGEVRLNRRRRPAPRRVL